MQEECPYILSQFREFILIITEFKDFYHSTWKNLLVILI